jgi:HK97 family phage prohead protease
VARRSGDATIIEGLIPYDSWSGDLGGFRERIQRGAFADSSRNGDVRALWSHDSATPLGRHANGTLRFRDSREGLRFEIEVNPRDVIATSIVARIARGDVDGSSFGFIVRSDADQEWREGSGLLERTIKRAELLEVSPVVWPAYPGSSAAARTATDRSKRGPSAGLLRRQLELDAARVRMKVAGGL